MGELFNVDNKLFQGINKLIDGIVLNVIWLVCCLPTIVTFTLAWQSKIVIIWVACWLTFALAGPATTALYYTINKVIRHSRGYMWKEYRHAFASNFKQAALAGWIVGAVGLFMGLDAYIMYQFAVAGEKGASLYVVFLLFILIVFMWAIYVFAYMARFENTLKQILKNAIFIAIGNLPSSIVLVCMLLAAMVAIWIVPAGFVFIPVVYMLFANTILEKVFLKYMSEEDIVAEEERNREFFN